MLEEVVKELPLNPRPFCLRKVVDAVSVVDLEDMLQVLPPSTAMKVCRQPHGITIDWLRRERVKTCVE